MDKKQLVVAAAFVFIFNSVFVQAAEISDSVSESGDVAEFSAMFGADLQEEDVYRADRLLVTATGSLKPVHLAPSVASVITAEDIEAMGATTLDEVLETVPGLHVSPSGLNIFSSIWSIRGMRTGNNPQVLLLINGLPLTRIIEGERLKTSNIPVAMISRVEVVRGPGSAVHGADAFSGTVNVITKDGHEVDGTKAGIRYGSFDTTDAWLQHGGTYGGWNLVAGVEMQKTQGDHKRIINQDGLGSGPPSLAPDELDTRAEQVDAHLGFNKEDRWVAGFYGHWHENRMGPGAVQVLNYDSLSDGNQLLFDIMYHNKELSKDWDVSIRGHYLYQELDGFFQFYPEEYLNAQGRPIGEENNGGLEAVGIYSGLPDHSLRFAAGFKYFDAETNEYKNLLLTIVPPSDWFGPMYSLRGTPDIFMEDQHRFLQYASFQDEWAFVRNWELTVGVRYDEYDDFGSTINPRLALVWEARSDLTAKILYGRAFRAPSFSEQYFQSNPVIHGNPDVNPEVMDSYELALDWQATQDLRIVPSVFYQEIDDLIQYVGPLPAVAENFATLKSHGCELDINWQVTRNFQVRGNLAYQRTENQETDEIMPDTPEWKVYADADWKFLPDWSINGQYFWIADRHRASGDPRPDIDNCSLVNLTLRRKNIAAHWDAALSLRNLFDEDIREPSPYDPTAPDGALIPDDYPMPGMAIWCEVRLHF